ncbi:HAD family hydrolase [Methanofervidicoccus sp. A16]|uniref:HAD family hydrolase n=1 Tax=Methanofervidicoccus sp. A16 TaxID=2607662 RepID=UPI001187899B|nr:HAD family hydrolase [Methanofervidicoccus sp. A16]AXI25793.1 HAD family hydrolase [Methanofervidicoccus sp. A16]
MLDIPNYKRITARNVIFDLNGTLAVDGHIDKEVLDLLKELSKTYKIVVLTADTLGNAKEIFKELDSITLEVIRDTEEKTEVAKKYTPYIGIGNGNNDIGVFKNAELSIAVIGREGCSAKLLLSADVVVCDIVDAINLLLKEKRLIATLRG